VVGETGIEPVTPDLEGRVYPITLIYPRVEACSVFRAFERFVEPRSLKRLPLLSLEGPHKSPHNFQRRFTSAVRRYSASPARCSCQEQPKRRPRKTGLREPRPNRTSGKRSCREPDREGRSHTASCVTAFGLLCGVNDLLPAKRFGQLGLICSKSDFWGTRGITADAHPLDKILSLKSHYVRARPYSSPLKRCPAMWGTGCY